MWQQLARCRWCIRQRQDTEIVLAFPPGNHAMGEARGAVATVSTVILWLVSSAFLPRSVFVRVCWCVGVKCWC